MPVPALLQQRIGDHDELAVVVGFFRTASAAPARSVFPLAARIGIPAVAGSLRSRRINSAPSMTGIMMSVTTRSGDHFPHGLQPGGAIARHDHLVPLLRQGAPGQEPLVRLVIHHENLGHLAYVPLRYDQ